MPKRRSTKRIVTLVVSIALIAIALLAAVFILWALTPLGPAPEALDALEGDTEVSVTEAEYGWVFEPKDDTPVTGIVFYPGGRVDARSYAPLAHDLALAGHLVIIVPMRLNLAVLSPNRADSALDANPQIAAWAMCGHSLGGTMAAQYAKSDPDRIKALALLASYPADSTDLSQSELGVTSIYGTLDGVLDEPSFTAAAPLLPESTEYVAIEGGNHAQFGSYGPQPGDNEASVSAQEQLDQTVEAIALLMRPIRLPLLH